MAKLNNIEITRKELLKKLGNVEQVAYIKPYEMSEGSSKGVKAFDVSNGGGLDFTVLESKCLDIFNMKYKGVNLSFISKPGLYAPEYFNPHGVEFFRHFQAGMLYTCGLSNIGVPCKDGNEEYNFHGRISQTPACKVSATSCWEGDEYIMKILGEMREAAHYKENLVLKRLITTKLGAKSVKIQDIVENQGYEEQPVMLLYHFNLGYPLLDEGARVLVPNAETTPRTDVARYGMSEFSKICAPVDQFTEHVFYHKNAADKVGNTYAALINENLSLGLYLKYNTAQLPILAEWKSMASGDYALGLEAGNHLLEGRDVERKKGTLKTLAPFGQMNFDLELGVLDGSKEIEEFQKMVESLRG